MMGISSRWKGVGRLWIGGTALALVLAGCGGGDGKGGKGGTSSAPSSPAAGRPAPALASRPLAAEGGPARAELLSLTPSAKNTVTARLRIVNEGGDDLDLRGPLADLSRDKQVGGVLGMGGIALVDGANMKMYYPLSTQDGHCLCSETDRLPSGQSREVYAVYPAPQSRKVTVWVPLAPPFTEVAIPSGSAPPAPGQTLSPQSASLAAPVIRSLKGTSEGVTESVDEDGGDTRVRLSTDVLFALNKADLTAKADDALRKVAAKIDASRGAVVKIDGYTDNSGNDAINNPLSRRRADAVQNRLKSLVNRQGVTFQSAGHGSADPIADNGTDEGRRKNRRVTVSFPRPPLAAPPASSPAPTATDGKLPVIASTRPHFTGVTADGNNFSFAVNALRREAGGLVVLTWTITNETDATKKAEAGLAKEGTLSYSAPGATGARLFDSAGQLRYWPMQDSADVCLCTQTVSGFHSDLEPHQGVTLSDVFFAPPEVRTVNVELPWYSSAVTLKNLTIS